MHVKEVWDQKLCSSVVISLKAELYIQLDKVEGKFQIESMYLLSMNVNSDILLPSLECLCVRQHSWSGGDRGAHFKRNLKISVGCKYPLRVKLKSELELFKQYRLRRKFLRFPIIPLKQGAVNGCYESISARTYVSCASDMCHV